ncbi:peptidylprolyl isomerase [uncultured Erythrobacter sp.]|uniref:peptidylprolyl isomerase n=1 Tax=uncultured Erythrobacter sp. TaxID=263913 RepID=UPI0026248121|nr:peptidylprolyl isomerase [uncultured Erythrobacter sp.]
MRHALLAAATLALTLPASAQEAPEGAPSPNQIVDAASAEEWVVIPPEDLLVMTLAPDAEGNEREVVIQLMPAPFSQGWVSNIKTLARAKWYDGITVNRVQDNYVVQWGDPGHDNPESGETETKPLPEGLKVMGEDEYFTWVSDQQIPWMWSVTGRIASRSAGTPPGFQINPTAVPRFSDPYTSAVSYSGSFPVGLWFGGDGPASFGSLPAKAWPVHCYGMVGVGRSYSPDTGSGAELYTVIGHAPRHLDRNIALVGRIVHGMEHLSSLPRGSGALGFYTEEEADKRTPILSIRVAADLSEEEQPQFEYLSTESESFVAYTEARANRRDPFFIVPAGGADICNIPVPIREVVPE